MAILIEEFSFGNFRSIAEIQTLRMSAAPIAASDMDENNILTLDNGEKLLRSKLIYGANASGKSNIFKAFINFQSYLDRTVQSEISTKYEPFALIESYLNEPSYYQIIIYIDDIKYRYGFEAQKDKITSEWLFLTTTSREVPVFIRENLNIVKLTKKYMPQGSDLINLKSKLFTEKTLFLKFTDGFNEKISEKLIDSISKIKVIGKDISKVNIHELVDDFVKEDQDKKKVILALLKSADVGIENFISHNFGNDEENKRIITISGHKKYDEDLKEKDSHISIFDIFESYGTKELFGLSTYIVESILEKIPLFIDEFGSNLHSNIVCKILGLFNNKFSTSQLIAATHTTELMKPKYLRKDQIDFVEKDKYGRTYLYSLAEIKGIRNNSNYEKDYLTGKYGAIPFLGDWNELYNLAEEKPATDGIQEEQ